MDSRVRELLQGTRAKAIVLSGVFAIAVLAGSVAVIAWGNDPTGAAEVFLEPADKLGRNPFADFLVLPVPSIASALDLLTSDGDGIAALRGDQVGLYGGTRNDQICDREQMIRFLGENPDKGAAWASVQGIKPGDIPGYLRSLTPLQLRVDTRVTNHGFVDGAATPLQSVLQAGTTVLVDRTGVPRARCACGNPLLPPQPAATKVSYKGEPWQGFSTTDLRRIVEGGPVKEFVVFDSHTNALFVRPVGTAGEADRDPTPGTKVTVAPKTTTTSTTIAPGSTATSAPTTSLGTQPGDDSSTTTTATTVTAPGRSRETAPSTSTATNPATTITAPQTGPTTPPATQPSTVDPPPSTSETTGSTATVPTTPPTDPPPARVSVPEVREQTEGTALRVLKESKLLAKVTTTVTAGAKPGTVVAQDPLPGTVVDEGTTVSLTVAEAPAQVVVPDTIKGDLPSAQKAIEGVGLVFKPNDAGLNQSLPCGGTLVRSSDPPPKTTVAAGSTVTVTYTRGPLCPLQPLRL